MDNGAQRLIEENLHRPLQRFNCLYHAAERPLRQFQELLDGATNGPVTTNGPIGRAQKDLDRFQGPFVRFTRIRNNLPPIDRDLLKSHTDLLCMYDFIDGIATGIVRAYLETKKAVPMNNARCL